MTTLSLSMVREIKEQPDRFAELARQVGPVPEVAVLQQFDALVVRTFAEFILCRLWGGLEAFCTSLVHASRQFAFAADDPRATVVRQWPMLLRLGQMLTEVARDERALDLVMASRDMQEVLRMLGTREPLASEDLCTELGKEAQNLCNLLRRMEDHGLISRRRAGQRAIVRLGPAGDTWLAREAEQPASSPEPIVHEPGRELTLETLTGVLGTFPQRRNVGSLLYPERRR